MSKFVSCFILGWIFLFFCSTKIKGENTLFNDSFEVIGFDTISYIAEDKYFIHSYNEIVRMLEGKDSLSIKRAEFLVEWAYLGGNLDYKKYCNTIDSVVLLLSDFIRINGLQQYKTAGHFALFEYFTKPNPLNGNKVYNIIEK